MEDQRTDRKDIREFSCLLLVAISLSRMLAKSDVLITVDNTASAYSSSVKASVREKTVRASVTKSGVDTRPAELRRVALKTEMDVLSDTASFFLPSSPESS